ncbi:Uncharacterised protein [uncultured archaeon]|nr:Uncharacterised protein [uncultured archaeon]
MKLEYGDFLIVRKEETVKFQNSTKCVAYEYPTHDADVNIAIVKISGRYPEIGQVMNEKVKEIVYVEKGSGRVVIEGQEHKLKAGDVVLLLPKKKYYWDGKLTIVSACAPAWYSEQHKTINFNEGE